MDHTREARRREGGDDDERARLVAAAAKRAGFAVTMRPYGVMALSLHGRGVVAAWCQADELVVAAHCWPIPVAGVAAEVVADMAMGNADRRAA